MLAGPGTGPTITGTRHAALAHDLDIEEVAPGDLVRRFPGFDPPAEAVVLFEPAAGTLAVEECVRAHVKTAQRLGATVKVGEQVCRWAATDRSVTIETDSARYHAGSLIITAGPWTHDVLADLNLPLKLRRKPVFWFASTDGRYHRDTGCPVFGFEIDDHFLYGFPSTDGASVKIGDHTGGDPIAQADDVDRNIKTNDLATLIPFIKSCLPGVDPRVVKHNVCIYTMTPDEQFIVDRHPQHANVVFAAGLSGHGFKFAPVLGSALIDLALTGRTEEPIGFLSLARPSLRSKPG